MRRIWSRVAVAILAVAGCQGSLSSTPSPSPSGGPPSAGAEIVLRRSPADLGCDSIGWPDDVEPFARLTFRIDVAAAEQVSAVSDTGVELVTAWAPGFEAGSATERLVRGPDGAVVARDGGVVDLPAGVNPDLHGYPLCVTPTSVDVMLPQEGGTGADLEPVPEPSALPSPASTASPAGLTEDERFLVAVLREDAATDCAPRRTGLPARSVIGIECSIGSELVDRVGVYGFRDYPDEAAAFTYLERMDREGVLGAAGDCRGGTPEDTPYSGTDGEPTGDGDQVEYEGRHYAQFRRGCFVNEQGIANFRATCNATLVGVLGQNGDLAALSEWALRLPERDEATGALYPGICAGALGGGLDAGDGDLDAGDTP